MPMDQSGETRAAAILARLDRLPGTRHVWMLIALLSLGGVFELYDLFMTGYLVPGLMKAGLLTGVEVSIFKGPALFVASDLLRSLHRHHRVRLPRRQVRPARDLHLLAALVQRRDIHPGLPEHRDGVNLWRLIGGIGIGVELVTIDTYISELVPKSRRGKAFAFQQAVGFCAVPGGAARLAARAARPARLRGWRWVVIIGSVGALFVWLLRRGLPEVAALAGAAGAAGGGRAGHAAIEAQVPPISAGRCRRRRRRPEDAAPQGRYAEVFAPAYRGRTIMMIVVQFLLRRSASTASPTGCRRC